MRTRMALALLPLLILLCTAPVHAASPSPSPLPSVSPDEPWWAPVAFAGQRVEALRTGGALVQAQVGGAWLDVPGSQAGAPPPARPAPTAYPGGPQYRDGFAAMPASQPGTVVAVDGGNTVWRHRADTDWGRALLLLPEALIHGPPDITGVAAFADQPLSDAIYLATDGYSVLESTDGGDDWLRAGPGLPDSVLAVLCWSPQAAVYAATSSGLYVHHLRPTPAPPVYAPQDLNGYIAATALITLLASALGVLGLRRLLI